MYEPRAGFLIVRTFEELYRKYPRPVPSGRVFYSIPRQGIPAESAPKKYRGLARSPLAGWPEGAWGREQDPRAAEEANACRALWDLETQGDSCDDFIAKLSDARQVAARLREPAQWEIIWARDLAGTPARAQVGRTLGYEPTWLTGDHFSALCDCLCFPRWHGTDEAGTLFAEFHQRLNEHALFDTPADAKAFLDLYQAQVWAETGDYVIAEICLPGEALDPHAYL